MVTIHKAGSVAAGVAACRLISSNVVSFSFNLVLSDLSFSLNVVPKPPMLLVPTVYVLGPLQVQLRLAICSPLFGASAVGWGDLARYIDLRDHLQITRSGAALLAVVLIGLPGFHCLQRQPWKVLSQALS